MCCHFPCKNTAVKDFSVMSYKLTFTSVFLGWTCTPALWPVDVTVCQFTVHYLLSQQATCSSLIFPALTAYVDTQGSEGHAGVKLCAWTFEALQQSLPVTIKNQSIHVFFLPVVSCTQMRMSVSRNRMCIVGLLTLVSETAGDLIEKNLSAHWNQRNSLLTCSSGRY